MPLFLFFFPVVRVQLFSSSAAYEMWLFFFLWFLLFLAGEIDYFPPFAQVERPGLFFSFSPFEGVVWYTRGEFFPPLRMTVESKRRRPLFSPLPPPRFFAAYPAGELALFFPSSRADRVFLGE